MDVSRFSHNTPVDMLRGDHITRTNRGVSALEDVPSGSAILLGVDADDHSDQ